LQQKVCADPERNNKTCMLTAGINMGKGKLTEKVELKSHYFVTRKVVE